MDNTKENTGKFFKRVEMKRELKRAAQVEAAKMDISFNAWIVLAMEEKMKRE